MERKDRALSGTAGNWLGRLLWLAGPLLGYIVVETLNYNNGWTDFEPLQSALNLIWYYILAGGVFLLFERWNLSAGVAAAAAGDGGAVTAPTNVIVIMGESFADLTVLGDFETNEDAMPYLHSLTENTVRGNAWVSVFGGTTANSEWEFLTGNTTAFLTAGAVFYQRYVNDFAAALPQQMAALGYRTVAIHPYYSSGWNWVAVYEDFGFDEAYFLGDFTDTDTVRGYVTDRSDYGNLIRLYEEKEPGEKLFVTGERQGRYGTVDQYCRSCARATRRWSICWTISPRWQPPFIPISWAGPLTAWM